MEDKIIIKLIENTLKDKIKSNPNYIRYSFYELRVKYNLSEEDTAVFLNLSTIRLQNIGYRVYYTNQEYEYKGEKRIVTSNELLVAIKK